MKEIYFQCPYCWENISMLFDTSITPQKFIEDCEVCCNPIEIEALFENFELVGLNVCSIEQ